MSAGRFTWYELMTTDTAAGTAFYTDLIGWKTQAFEGAPYTMLVGSQGPLGGVNPLPEQAKAMGAPSHWLGSVIVKSADDTCAKVKKLGGQILVEPRDMPTVGRLAVFMDPQGGVIAIIAPAQDMGAHDVTKAGEICWRELMTTDLDKGTAFYRDIFGWEVLDKHDMGEMGAYLIYGQGETQYGGMFAKPAGAPGPGAAWLYYVHVDDLDASFEKAKSLGATVLMGPHAVPTGERIAQLVDPQGAAFALHGAALAK